tara:strand:+ start:2992 stop:3534 length:543 start_codon:yes stop_codon:yes gene_type:complete
MRTIAINPVRRKKKMAARKRTRKSPARRPAARRAPARKSNPVRRRRSNPKAGLTAADVKDLGTAGIGGAAAGALTAYLEGAKPKMLEAVPTEVVSAGLGIALAMFGKTPALKNVSRGMVSYAAGRITERMIAPGPPAAAAQTSGLVFANPGHYGSLPNPGHYSNPHDELHVGGLVFSMED